MFTNNLHFNQLTQMETYLYRCFLYYTENIEHLYTKYEINRETPSLEKFYILIWNNMEIISNPNIKRIQGFINERISIELRQIIANRLKQEFFLPRANVDPKLHYLYDIHKMFMKEYGGYYVEPQYLFNGILYAEGFTNILFYLEDQSVNISKLRSKAPSLAEKHKVNFLGNL